MQTLRLVEALTDNGHHCVTVCYFEYDIHIVRMYEQAGSRVVCLSAYGERPSSQRRIYSFLKSGLSRAVREYRPKVALVQYMAPGAMPLLILRRLGMKNIIAMLHTDADIYKSLRLVHFLQRRVARLFTCVTETAERNFFGNSKLIDNLNAKSRHDHCTLPNCLPKDYTFFNSLLQASDAQVTIGFVARLEEIKGADMVIPAFAKVLEKQPDARLLIVGDGKLKEKMLQQQDELNIAGDKIEWAGMLDYRKLPDYYSRMTLVWVPSRSEGFGLSAIEAMGKGCPVIASSTGGLTEIVHDESDGLLFEPENINDLATKTLQMLGDSTALQTMGCNAVATAKQYSFEIYKQRVEKIF